MTEVQKIDSNQTGLRICEEESLGVLPAAADQVWYPKEPNSYSDFGGQIKTVARKPINASRQNQKGVTVDLDAAGGLNQDFTQTNFIRELRGFFFASIREMFDSQAIDNEVSDLSAVEDSDDTYRFLNGTDIVSPRVQAQALVYATGFANEANNGVNVVNSIARTKATGTLTLTPGAIADDVVEIDNVYYQFAADPTTGTPNGTIGSPFLVDVGGTDTVSLANLRKAINNTGTPGTTYSEEINTLYPDGHPTVTATASDATTLTAQALNYGYGGNLLHTSVIATGGSDGLAWGGSTLTGGTASIDVAANLADETPADGHATGTLTFTAGAIADDLVEIDGVYYTWAADPTTGTPDGSSGNPYLVDLGASDTISLANLRKAINASGTSGVTYAAEVVQHTTVEAISSSSTTLVVRARAVGAQGNNITTSVTAVSSADGLAWGTATLTGGADAGARVQVVGYEFAVGTADVSVSNDLPRIVRASGVVDFSALGLIPGQFVFIGGDEADESFVNEENNGWARVHSVAASYIQFDKTTSAMVAEVGSGLTIRIWYGKVLKNELAESGLIIRRSFQIERDLGQADTAITAHQGEYLKGSIANQLTLNVKQADKFNADLSFVAIDHETRDQTEGLKSAAAPAQAPALVSEDAFNTSDNIPRLRMTVLDRSDSFMPTLFAYLTDFTVVINNNVKPSKAVSVLGAFDATAGNFDISGKVTAYFSKVAGVATIRANADVTLDFAFAFNNQGFVWDIPLMSLGDGRLTVEQDTEIKLPLDMNAAEDRVFHHTLLYGVFPYLPDAAM